MSFASRLFGAGSGPTPRSAESCVKTVTAVPLPKETTLIEAAIAEAAAGAPAPLDQGAQLDALDQCGLTALIWASAKGCLEDVQRLLARGAGVDARDGSGATALMWASVKGHSELVHVLLAQGARVNAGDKQGVTALMWASEHGHCEVVLALLAGGAEVNARDHNGVTALICAVGKGRLEVVQALLAAWADANAERRGKTALMEASENGYCEVVQALLAAGAAIDARDEYGLTALIWACQKGCREVVQLLLDAGAQANDKDINGVTVLMWACEKGQAEVAQLLLAAGAEDDLTSAANRGDRDAVQSLLAKNVPMKRLAVLATSTARSGSVYMARLLTSLGLTCGHEAVFGCRGLAYAVHVLRTGELGTSFVSTYDVLGNQVQPPWFDRNALSAESSHMAAPFIDAPCLDGAAVVHVVRNPLAVVSSLVHDMRFFCDETGYFEEFRKFVCSHMPDVMHLPTEIERACMYWIQWNEMIARKAAGKPYLVFKVESKLSDELLEFLKIPASMKNVAYSNDKTNSWKLRQDDLALADIPEGEVKDRLIILAERLGYPCLSPARGLSLSQDQPADRAQPANRAGL